MSLKLACLVGVALAFTTLAAGYPQCSDVATNCASLSPTSCLSERNAALCCQTCRQHYTGNSACPYGDQEYRITKNGQTYNCETYVRVWGDCKCRETQFREICCKSCEGARLS